MEETKTPNTTVQSEQQAPKEENDKKLELMVDGLPKYDATKKFRSWVDGLDLKYKRCKKVSGMTKGFVVFDVCLM